jgi:hypothetical protein
MLGSGFFPPVVVGFEADVEVFAAGFFEPLAFAALAFELPARGLEEPPEEDWALGVGFFRSAIA